MYHLVLIISSLLVFETLFGSFAAAGTSTPENQIAQPLHVEIDRIVDAERVGPQASRCTDSEFLRRVYLDLAGKIPTAQEALDFLQDSHPDKRARLIDTLLETPHFDRNFMRVLDVMFMERRIEKVISPGKFREFLRTAIEDRQPLNELIREILIADGAKDEERSAARFLLDRSAEPHILTRDVGRLFLRVDMQCAQCHDHPSIGDYLQSDYYGIYAFLNRTYLFGSEIGSVVAERAEGEVEFVSVFVGGDPQAMMPHLPGRNNMTEPTMTQEERYIVKPAEGVRPIPKFSRRSLLATELTSGKYNAFQKNLANRLWAHMFGRGIVHPLDFHHTDNPPTNPELLFTLAEGLADLDFDLRKFLREIALSKTYQRSSELPSQLLQYAEKAKNDREKVTALLKKARDNQKKLNKQLQENSKSLAEYKSQQDELERQDSDIQQRIDALANTINARQSQLRTYQAAWHDLEQAEKKLNALKEQAEELRQLDPDDQQLQQLAQSTAKQYQFILEERNVSLEKMKGIKETLRAQTEAKEKFSAEVTGLNKKLLKVKNEYKKIAASGLILEHQNMLQQNRIVALRAKTEDLELLDQWAKTQKENPADSAAQLDARQAVANRWRNRFQCGHILPLTAEQLTWSVSEALGIVAQKSQEIRRKQQEKKENATDAKKEGSVEIKLKEKQLIKSLHNQVEGGALYDFIINVHDFRGQPDGSYQATAKEALFLSHSKKLQTWIEQAAKQWVDESPEDLSAESVAKKLYLAILSRQPDAEEEALVRGYLVARTEDPHTALQDLIWALLSCTEFRFQS